MSTTPPPSTTAPPPPPTRHIRPAHQDDAAHLCRAEQLTAAAEEGLLVSHPDEFELQAFRDRILRTTQGVGACLVAELHGERVGHGALTPLPRRATAHVVQLDLCVHPGHRGHGHGAALLQALVAWARQAPDVHKIELLVRATNHPAVSLYTRAGFVEEGRLEHRVRLRDGHWVDDLSMALFVD